MVVITTLGKHGCCGNESAVGSLGSRILIKEYKLNDSLLFSVYTYMRYRFDVNIANLHFSFEYVI